MAHKQGSRDKEPTSDSKEINEIDEQVMEKSLSENKSKEDSSLKNHENKEKKKSKPSTRQERRRPNENEDNKEEDNENSRETKWNQDLNQYLPLYGAALQGDWESAEKFIKDHPKAATAKITAKDETALHIAVSGSKPMKFVRELVTKYPALLEEVDYKNNTALFYASASGNTEVAKYLVGLNSNLAHKRGYHAAYTPLHIAAENGHKDIVDFLLSVTKDKHPSIFEGDSGIHLLRNLITAGLTGIALDILKQYPALACEKCLQSFALKSLAQMPSLFLSGTQLIFWKHIIFQEIPIEKHNLSAYSKGGDIENSIDSLKDCCATSKSTMPRKVCSYITGMCREVRVVFWKSIKQLVPSISHIYEIKITHVQTLELVKLLLRGMTLSQETAKEFLAQPLFRATELGIHELVKEIIKNYPPLALFLDDENRSIFQLAVFHRQQKVIDVIYQMGLYKRLREFKDNEGNNILHLAAKLHNPSSQVSNPVVRMHQELQWFKEIKTLAPPSFQQMRTGSSKLTPRQLFTKEHATLVKEGERWVKEVAKSYIVAATLIVTLTFAAAFTVPGGNNDDGIPIFLDTPSFRTFLITDAMALFFSTISVLMFLGIEASRCLEEDFLESLTSKLVNAVHALSISIILMMVAFIAALHIIAFEMFKVYMYTVALLACWPVTVFVLWLIPYIVKFVHTIYGLGVSRAVK